MAVKKAKGKEWFTIIAPKVFNEMEIAKTMAADGSSLVNRRIAIGLIELTNDFSKYYMKFFFRIKRVEGDKAFTEFDGSECLRDYISRMVLRRVRRIDTVQDLVTKDGKKVRVKGLAVISRKIKSTVKKTVGVKIKEIIKKEVESSTLDNFVRKIISDNIKKKVLREGRKIYPIRKFEIRKTEVFQ